MGEDSLPTGIIYKTSKIPFHERLDVLKKKPLFAYSFDKSKLSKILDRM